jgi:hypothetical protein
MVERQMPDRQITTMNNVCTKMVNQACKVSVIVNAVVAGKAMHNSRQTSLGETKIKS